MLLGIDPPTGGGDHTGVLFLGGGGVEREIPYGFSRLRLGEQGLAFGGDNVLYRL